MSAQGLFDMNYMNRFMALGNLLLCDIKVILIFAGLDYLKNYITSMPGFPSGRIVNQMSNSTMEVLKFLSFDSFSNSVSHIEAEKSKTN